MSESPVKKPAGEPTITVMINGQRVTVPKTTPHPVSGQPLPTTMIQACEAAQVEVPHYCYHPKLPVAGNCRMCLVEFGTPALGPDRQPVLNPDGSPKINKAPNPAIACATPISPGMEIYTNTPSVEAMRKAVLEFLLINHPLDCPICDQAGECKLQEYSYEYGQSESRFIEPKVRKPKQVELGPRIMLDDERCILCSRCIRFTRDIVGDDALGIINRGSYSTLTTYPGRSFDNNYTLNTADICPVGALTSKDFRFKMRVWFLKETKSICPNCATGCNITINSRENTLYRFLPRQNDAVNSCWMCDYGRLHYKWVNRADRLAAIILRLPFVPTATPDWREVIREVANLLKNAPAQSIAIIASARQTNEELFLLTRLARQLGAMIDSVPRQGEGDHLLLSSDRNPNSLGARLIGASASPMGSLLPRIKEGIERGQIQTLLVFGEEITRLGFTESVLDRLKCLVVSDILPNATTPRAHCLLPGCAFAEKRGTFTNRKGRVQKFMRGIEPPGQARAEWEFLAELFREISGAPVPVSIEGLFNWMAEEVPAFRGITFSSLGDGGQPASLEGVEKEEKTDQPVVPGVK